MCASKEALRDVDIAAIDCTFGAGGMSAVAMKRARHVVTENQRCQDAVLAFKSRDYSTVGLCLQTFPSFVCVVTTRVFGHVRGRGRRCGRRRRCRRGLVCVQECVCMYVCMRSLCF